MCGIVGYFDKTSVLGAPLGEILLRMLYALACRGPDSAGVAMFGSDRPKYFVAQVKLSDNGDSIDRARLINGAAQSFWAHGYPDLAIVHNGHITNYHQLRRRYEQRGTRFYTENDSEIVAMFLAEKLRKGADLGAALNSMVVELDGSFSCLAATDSAFG